MHHFSSFDGTDIAYLDTGTGDLTVLLHGFAADHAINWVAPGIVAALVDSGRRVVAPDARGHGASAKPHDLAAYANDAMGRDVEALLDHLDAQRADIVGYSMGAMTTARVVARESRARSAVLGGIGVNTGDETWARFRDSIADALEAKDPGEVQNVTARAFRRFADHTGADRLALAAIQRTAHPAMGVERINVPTLVIVGDDDTLVGAPEPLAERIPGATSQRVQGDHLTAPSDPAFARAIIQFIDGVAAR